MDNAQKALLFVLLAAAVVLGSLAYQILDAGAATVTTHAADVRNAIESSNR